MSTAYETTGRVAQKSITRQALITAARELVAKGQAPTVEEAAACAGVSRTTAYRYFASQHALLAAAHPETVRTTMLSKRVSDDPVERLDAVLKTFIRMVCDTEAQQRTMLRLSLSATAEERAALPLRQGRAIAWIGEALAPLAGTLTADQLHELTLAIRATTGIESLVWLVDVAGLSRREAARLMRSSALSLLRDALRRNA
jgi:AcrR family transcriptional regulator